MYAIFFFQDSLTLESGANNSAASYSEPCSFIGMQYDFHVDRKKRKKKHFLAG